MIDEVEEITPEQKQLIKVEDKKLLMEDLEKYLIKSIEDGVNFMKDDFLSCKNYLYFIERGEQALALLKQMRNKL